MIIGYARVSTDDQHLDRQIDSLKQHCERIYQEKITGTKRDRPELDKLLDNLRPGDTVTVSELTRLSRSTKDLFDLVEQIHFKGADIKSLKESWLDTTTSTGKLMFTIIAGISQFERDLISDRTKEGLKSARARGRFGGRPKKDTKDIERALKLYVSKEHSIKDIIEMTGVSKTSLYRYIDNSVNKSVSKARDIIKKENPVKDNKAAEKFIDAVEESKTKPQPKEKQDVKQLNPQEIRTFFKK